MSVKQSAFFYVLELRLAKGEEAQGGPVILDRMKG
jgi:hypothetical protein